MESRKERKSRRSPYEIYPYVIALVLLISVIFAIVAEVTSVYEANSSLDPEKVYFSSTRKNVWKVVLPSGSYETSSTVLVEDNYPR